MPSPESACLIKYIIQHGIPINMGLIFPHAHESIEEIIRKVYIVKGGLQLLVGP